MSQKHNVAPLSVTTDYRTGSGYPEPYLRRIAEAGFTHVHWCHHWDSDFLYADCEIRQIIAWLKQFGLRAPDLHASAGIEKCWFSTREYERLAGVELVRNRIETAARLGGDVIVMHGFPGGMASALPDAHRDALRRSLDGLRSAARKLGVRIAVENTFPASRFDEIERLFAEFEPDYLGLCYDSGHGNISGDGLDGLSRLGHRLVAIHLHDNAGREDSHLVPFEGTVDWPRLIALLAGSSYDKCITLEPLMPATAADADQEAFLRGAFDAGQRLSEMLARARAMEDDTDA